MNSKLLKAILFAGTAALAGQAHAINWGATVGYSTLNAEDDDNNGLLDGDIDFLSIGATLDTSTPTGLFGYRGTLSYITGEYELDTNDFQDNDSDYDGFSIDNTFAFRVGGDASQRFWVGPAIDVQIVSLDDETGFDRAVGVGLGASAGVDFYQPNGQFFSFEGGVRFGQTTLDADDNTFDDDDDIDLDTNGLFIRASYFFAGGPSR